MTIHHATHAPPSRIKQHKKKTPVLLKSTEHLQLTKNPHKKQIQPGGQDSQLVLPDTLQTYVTTNYLLKTADAEPAYITISTTGWRTGPKEVLEKLFDPELANEAKPSDYVFRLSIKLETGDERYKDKVNTGLWVGSGARRGSEGEVYFFFILFFSFFFLLD